MHRLEETQPRPSVTSGGSQPESDRERSVSSHGVPETKDLWDDIHRAEGLGYILPDRDVENLLLPALNKRGKATVLDLGCGTGRHLVFLAQSAQCELTICGSDISSVAISSARKWLDECDLDARLVNHAAESLPYPNGAFDCVLTVQVIHHNCLAAIRKTISEIARVLKPGGILLVTVPFMKNEPSSLTVAVERNTWLPVDGRERGILHHYFSEEELRALLASFSILSFRSRIDGHFCILAQLAER